MNTNHGGEAFPQPMILTQGGSGVVTSDEMDRGGMSLRDWFAGMSIPLLANDRLLRASDSAFPNDSTRVAVAKYAYAVADAMLAERERKE